MQNKCLLSILRLWVEAQPFMLACCIYLCKTWWRIKYTTHARGVMTLWLPSRLFWLGSQSQSQPLDSVCSGVRVRVDSRIWASESESVHWLFKNGSQSQSQSQITPVMSCDLWLGHKDDNLLRLAEKRLWLFDSRVDSLTLSRQLYILVPHAETLSWCRDKSYSKGWGGNADFIA